MKRQTLFQVGLVFFLIFGLTGCGSSNQPSHATKKASKTISIKQGSKTLLDTAKQLKKASEAGNKSAVQKLGPKLEDNWSVYEDQVKSSYPDLYEKVEKYLNPAVAGSKASTLDKAMLESLVDQLIATVQELEKKAKN
jgi:iron uptake system EfeUOB component EfeO/EfeM